jgi:hypothetical protein
LTGSFLTSRVVVAFLGFVIFGFALQSLCPNSLLETYNPREKTLLADLVKAWKATPQAPNICFLGSSLVQCALKNSDPTFLSHVLTHDDAPSFSWALGGENASDAYMIASTMMSGAKKPRLVIYGIAPRDLLDNNVKSPVSTDIFRYLSTSNTIFSLPGSAFTSIDDRVAFSLKQFLFLVDRKEALSKYVSNQLQIVLPEVLPAMRNAKTGTEEQQKIATAQAQIEASAKAQIKAPALNVNNQEVLAAKQIAAYDYLLQVSKGVTIFRYHPYSAERYDRQVVFLDKLLAHLESIGVPVILVKMPLKNEHVAIMPKELLESYTKDVDRLATKYGASVLDFNTSDFKDSNYGDVAHLNATGARIFQDLLVKTFTAPPYRAKLASINAPN